MCHMSIKDMGASYAPSLMGFVKQAMGTRRAQQLSIAEADVGIIVLVDFACTGSIKDHAALWLLFGTDVVGRRAPHVRPLHHATKLEHVQYC